MRNSSRQEWKWFDDEEKLLRRTVILLQNQSRSLMHRAAQAKAITGR